jgi:hypothetical protein
MGETKTLKIDPVILPNLSDDSFLENNLILTNSIDNTN